MTIGPDNMIYFNLGAPFNIGIPPPVGAHNLTFGTIARMSLNGTNISTYATGTNFCIGQCCIELQHNVIKTQFCQDSVLSRN